MPRSLRAVIAVDINVVVRMLTGDDPNQAARARRLFEVEAILLPKTVVLETEWVLRRLYGRRKGAGCGSVDGAGGSPQRPMRG